MGELLLGDGQVLVASVGLGDHQLELVVRHGLAQLHCDFLQVLERDHPLVVEGEELKGPLDFLLRLLLVHFGCHDLQELRVVDGVVVFLVLILGVQVRQQLLDLVFLGLKTQGPQCHFQLLNIYDSRAVCVEEVECFLNVLLLLFAELLPEGVFALGLLALLLVFVLA